MYYVRCLECHCGGPVYNPSRCLIALPVVKIFMSSAPSEHMGNVLDLCMSAQPGQDNLPAVVTSFTYIRSHCMEKNRPRESETCGQETCCRGCVGGPGPAHSRGSVWRCTQLAEETLRKYSFQIASLLTWFVMSDFWTSTWKDKGGRGKEGETFACL